MLWIPANKVNEKININIVMTILTGFFKKALSPILKASFKGKCGGFKSMVWPDFNTFNSIKPTKWLNIAKWSVFDLLSIVF